ncbi:hypothetical protein H6F43_03810 [Leptolyngbya sp. FACHB-36]|uniref:hypothetical protein n=1 Tax=Leptolyngbya sp. FACHB-36 TaxID=2692808 RepID=UPI0016808032|nr:hypothetical protein [Leptolyngbya sp. FACHB-36]MBD2019308.1 hypothetical protein [Leptolyngbya sp. FACHB-36]
MNDELIAEITKLRTEASELRTELAELRTEIRALYERQGESETIVLASVAHKKQNSQPLSRTQALRIGLYAFIAVLLVSSFSLRGKLGDTEYHLNPSIESAIQLLVALSTGGTALGVAWFFGRDKNDG